MMNHIYKQSKGICTAYAFANAYEKLTGIILTEEEIWDLFKESGGSDDPSEREGAISYPDILTTAKHKGLIKEFKKVYFNPAIYIKKSLAKAQELHEGKMAIFNALEAYKKNYAVVLGIWVPSGGLKLTTTGYPLAGDLKGYHAVHLYRIGRDKRRTVYIVENSWGPKWGLDGLFKMTESDFDRMVREAYIIIK